MKLTRERIGELLIISNIIIWSLCPIIVKSTENMVSPFLFAAITNFVSGIFFFLILIYKKNLKELLNKRVLLFQIASVLLNGSFWVFFNFAAQNSSPGNVAILLQTSVPIAIILFGITKIEKINLWQIIGSTTIVGGSLLILMQNYNHFSYWEYLVPLTAGLMVIGNFFNKKVLEIVSLNALMSWNILTGLILLIVGQIIDSESITQLNNQHILILILATTLLTNILNAILWLEGLRRIKISKAFSLDASTPAFSLLFAYIFLKDIPTIYQISGFIIVFIGLMIITAHQDNEQLIVKGTTIKGKGLSRQLGFPTINVQINQLLNISGVFAGSMILNDQIHHGAIFIAKNTEYKTQQTIIEIHLFDFNQNIAQGTKTQIIIKQKIRDTQIFKNRNELIKAITNDCMTIKKM